MREDVMIFVNIPFLFKNNRYDKHGYSIVVKKLMIEFRRSTNLNRMKKNVLLKCTLGTG